MRLAAKDLPFSSDDVRQELDKQGIRVDPHAIGGAFREAKLSGLVEWIGETPSRIPSNHGRKVDCWRMAGGRKPMAYVRAEQLALVGSNQ